MEVLTHAQWKERGSLRTLDVSDVGTNVNVSGITANRAWEIPS